MTKWEYIIRTVPDGKVYELDLNALGEMGWELVSVVCENKLWLVFKRPIEPSFEEQLETMRMCCERKE